MAFNAASFFAGIATVIATVAIGFAGGVLLTEALVGPSEKPSSVIARRAAEGRPVAAAGAAQGSTSSAPVVVAPPAIPAAVNGPDISSAAAQPVRRVDESLAKARDVDLRKATAAEQQRAQRRKLAERRKREARRLEQQAAEQTRAAQREQGPGRTLFAEPPHVRIFGGD